MTPVSVLFWLLGVRVLSIDLTQVGSVFYLDLILRENQVRQFTPRYKLFACRSAYVDANPYAVDLYRPYLAFVKNPFLKLALSPFFMNPFFKENSFRCDPTETFNAPEGERRTFVHQIWREHTASRATLALNSALCLTRFFPMVSPFQTASQSY